MGISIKYQYIDYYSYFSGKVLIYWYMINLDDFGKTPKEIIAAIASSEKEKRKKLGITQKEMSIRSGIPLSTLRRFEQTGEISLISLAKIAIVLNDEDGITSIFRKVEYASMKELLDARHHKG